MLLLTGATGLVGSALLRRLTAAGTPVRCLVRDPRGLGSERVRVQIALGDLADPLSFRHALRGVDTVVHLAASIRDQSLSSFGGGIRSIEELNGVATWRMVQAARRAGVRRFVFFSALNASTHSPARFLRAKALAESAVRDSGLESTVFAPSIVYTPGDPYLTLLERLSLLPLMPLPGPGRALYQPIWADDVADCVMAILDGRGDGRDRYELAGPETITHQGIVELALRSAGRRRALLRVPLRLVRLGLRAIEEVGGPTAFATWDEAQLMEISMTTPTGTADAERLGVRPRTMGAVLGVG